MPEVDRLPRRSVLGVDRRRGHRPRQSGGEPGTSAGVERLHADLRRTARDDVADAGRVHPGTVENHALHTAQQVHPVHAGQAAVATSERGSHHAGYDHVTHRISFDRLCNSREAA
jgi:hypothetical protein